MSSTRQMIGYNRTVKLRWLDETVDLLLAGQSEMQIRDILRERLRDELSIGRDPERGSREKTITLLLRTWVKVPPHLEALRHNGLQLLQQMPRTARLPVHWGMTMAAYPFWRAVADVTGRLFRLQGTASAPQLQRRIRETHGEREVVRRSARYVLRAFADWGVIVDSGSKGTYKQAPSIRIDDPAVATWLLEATLLASTLTAVDFKALLNSPALFPFQLPRISASNLTDSGRVEIVRHGLESDLVLVPGR